MAFKNCVENAEGATLYVTLEPCSHYGKTPPCVVRVIKEKVKRVVIGMLDPNPLVAGRSIKRLQEEGIEVTVGVMEDKCKSLNAVFCKYILEQTPFVLLKTAMSLDGKIATVTGESRWITGEAAREEVHHLRHLLKGIMVGSETVLKDNPRLDCRITDGRCPIPIVVDSRLRIPLTSYLVTHAKVNHLIVATLETCEDEKVKKLEAVGVSVLKLPEKAGHVDLKALMQSLGVLGIDGILLEGGGTLNEAALKAGIVDQVRCYIHPSFIGGKEAPTPVTGEGFLKLQDSVVLQEVKIHQIGEDICIEGLVQKERGNECLQAL